jgi:hypothetical protein
MRHKTEPKKVLPLRKKSLRPPEHVNLLRKRCRSTKIIFPAHKQLQKRDFEYIEKAHNGITIEEFAAIATHNGLSNDGLCVFTVGHYRGEPVTDDDICIPKGITIGIYACQQKEEDFSDGHAYAFTSGKFMLDAEKQGNLTRFINHSDSPNLEAKTRADGQIVFVAKRNIYFGEELTFNYGAAFPKDGFVYLHPCYPGWMSSDYIFHQYGYKIAQETEQVERIKKYLCIDDKFDVEVNPLHLSIMENDIHIDFYDRVFFQLPVLLIDKDTQIPLPRNNPQQSDLMPLTLACLLGHQQMAESSSYC